MNKEVPFMELLGLTLIRIEGMTKGSEKIVLETSCGRTFEMFHDQDCCESVYVEDVVGFPDHLLGMTILQADEEHSPEWYDPEKYDYNNSSHTWTFYRLSTNRGMVVIRWLGESNGYYSESVEMIEL